jgi:hypothetical protein
MGRICPYEVTMEFLIRWNLTDAAPLELNHFAIGFLYTFRSAGAKENYRP